MISLIAFLIALVICAGGFSLDMMFKKNWFIKPATVSGVIAILIFIAACVIPSCLQEQDKFNIAFAQKNIELYNQQITDYTAAAQKQISDYQAAQSQLARTASSLQLQFYSQQADSVGNKLTDQIKAYNDKILDWKIEINKSTVRMEYRPKNKWVFGL